MSELGVLAAAWWSWMAPLAVQAAAFAALVLLLDRLLLRRGWPRLLHALWLLAALRFVLPPTLAAPTGIGNWLDALQAVGPAGLGPATAPPAAQSVMLLLLWLVGALVAAALALRARVAARAALRGVPAPAWMQRTAADCARRLGLRRAPALVVVPALSGACVHGPLRPVIALPARVARDELEPLLLHELAHVRRRDLWCDAALSALCVVFWFHPAAWLTRARLAQWRELCCDEEAVAALGPRAGAYRATLLRAAARMLGAAAPQPGFLGGTSQIVLRLRSLERAPARHPALRAAATLLATLLLAACVLPMGRHASPAVPDAASVAAARGLIASALDGSSRPGCIRLHYAALIVAADPAPDSSDWFPSPIP